MSAQFSQVSGVRVGDNISMRVEAEHLPEHVGMPLLATQVEVTGSGVHIFIQ